jgi:membrane protease YdiL (CAAX protease family)
MAEQQGDYYPAVRHPWPCLLFLLPLLATYETGVFLVGGAHPETVRNGADFHLRHWLERVGVTFWWLPPVVLALVFVGWALVRRKDAPRDLLGVLSGMALESVVYALGLWAVSRGLAPLLSRLGVDVASSIGGWKLPMDSSDPTVRQFITYLGAGIYEEALFRLVLFSVLLRMGRFVELPRVAALLVAAFVSAVPFSAAHHIGPHGQPYSHYLFLFRVVAGVYFALLYHFRGFGIAVGAHACYNVMVSVT